MRASLLDSLDDFERWGDDYAYVFPRGYRRERWSYQRVAAVAYQFAHELEARRIVKGDAVLLWSPNCAEWVAAFLGCALCGVIAVPVDDGASPDFARRISTQVRTKLVLCPRERAAIFDEPAAANLGAEKFMLFRKIRRGLRHNIVASYVGDLVHDHVPVISASRREDSAALTFGAR